MTLALGQDLVMARLLCGCAERSALPLDLLLAKQYMTELAPARELTREFQTP